MNPILIVGIIVGGIIVVIMLIAFGIALGILSEIRSKDDKIKKMNEEHEEQMRRYYARHQDD